MAAPDSSNLQQLIQDGIQAYHAGDHMRARDLFLRVVEMDERIELAWLWLFEVVEDPSDKVTALENVLSINPKNTEARQRLVRLQQQTNAPSDHFGSLAASPAPAPAPQPAADAPRKDVWRTYLPEVPIESDDGIDDPYQCAYCGALTDMDDLSCPHCHRNLMRRVQQSQNSEYLQLVLLFLGIGAGIAVVEGLGPLFAMTAAGTANPSSFVYLSQVFGVEALLGRFLEIPAALAPSLLVAFLTRSGIYVGMLLSLNARWAWAYYGSIVLLIADVLLSIFLVVSGWLGIIGGVANAILAIVILMLLFASDREFAVNQERILTAADAIAFSASDFYRRGHEYRRRGMWALAVAQWRRAVGLAPTEVLYYKDLGIGYAQIGRYARSLRALAQAQRLAPDDEALAEIVELVRARAGQAKRPGA